MSPPRSPSVRDPPLEHDTRFPGTYVMGMWVDKLAIGIETHRHSVYERLRGTPPLQSISLSMHFRGKKDSPLASEV
ncbi:hypothetical protein Tco_1391375 [Tanacetum coccineum]|uniref:Uncharacterized protein n=1 Tax=Tanacetum coccineum TaxID=301880 RepID=A0ABQ5E116_9ASTR